MIAAIVTIYWEKCLAKNIIKRSNFPKKNFYSSQIMLKLGKNNLVKFF